MRFAAPLMIAALALTACGPDEDDILFDGQFFRTKIDTDRGSREEFTVSVQPVSASLVGAREAARYEATVYCVNRYGSSAIDWDVGPDSPDEALTIQDDKLLLKGTCPQ
ncbi:MAG: hypothetical protein WBV78_04015 [Roseobacter sp.]